MIPAMVLCAHLTAAHAVTNCSKAPGKADTALFATSDGPGIVFQLSDASWASARGKGPIEAELTSVFGRPGFVVGGAEWAHVVVVTSLRMPERARWWLDIIESQAFERAEVKRYQDAIAKERANPAGVVDLEFLHDLGDALEAAREKLSENAVEYRQAIGLPMPGGL